MEAIRTQGLTQTFGDNTAVNNLTLTLKEGEVFGLVGPDGAGKTTVMRLLAGLMPPTAGDAWVYGCHTVKDAEQLRHHISYMPQRFGLYLDLTVQENIDFYADLYNVSRQTRKEKIPELLAFSNMTEFRDRQARNLSGGMKQKLALACALVHPLSAAGRKGHDFRLHGVSRRSGTLCENRSAASGADDPLRHSGRGEGAHARGFG